jgi:hypothetical protein
VFDGLRGDAQSVRNWAGFLTDRRGAAFCFRAIRPSAAGSRPTDDRESLPGEHWLDDTRQYRFTCLDPAIAADPLCRIDGIDHATAMLAALGSLATIAACSACSSTSMAVTWSVSRDLVDEADWPALRLRPRIPRWAAGYLAPRSWSGCCRKRRACRRSPGSDRHRDGRLTGRWIGLSR